MNPKGAEHLAMSGHSATVVGILALALPLALFIALRWLHEPKITFHEVSIVSQSDEPDATLPTIAREESTTLIRRAHVEIIALTLLALTLSCFLFSQATVLKRTKYLVIMSTVASIAACWSQW